MSVLRAKDAAKLNEKDAKTRLDELQFSLMKGSVTAQKTHAKTKEVKKAIARLLTMQRLRDGGVKKQ